MASVEILLISMCALGEGSFFYYVTPTEIFQIGDRKKKKKKKRKRKNMDPFIIICM